MLDYDYSTITITNGSGELRPTSGSLMDLNSLTKTSFYILSLLFLLVSGNPTMPVGSNYKYNVWRLSSKGVLRTPYITNLLRITRLEQTFI